MRRAPLVISIIALVLAATGVAVSAPKGPDGVIYACYDQRALDNGNQSGLAVVNAGDRCDKPGADFPDALTFNASGPAGATGAPGAVGPTGPKGADAPVTPVVPAKQVEKVDAAEKKTEAAQEKLEDAAGKIDPKKASAAEIAKFVEAVTAMIRQITSVQQIQLGALKALPAGAARDQAIKQAEAQIKAAAMLLAKLSTLAKDKNITKAELDRLLTQLPTLLGAVVNGQSAISDGLAGRLTDVKPPTTKKP